MTCDRGHGEISYKGRKCPLCKTLDHNRKLKRTVDDLQLELLVSENELLFDFDMTGERKIFSYVGQA